jgi:NADPH2:quinone reductase
MATALQLQSTVRNNATLEVSLADIEVPVPGADEVLVRVEAAPINPSDLGLLFGPADIGAATSHTQDGRSLLRAPIAANRLGALAARIDQALPVGNEGAGVVVAAGASPPAQALLGKTVAVFGGAMYGQFRCVAAQSCLALPAGITPRQGASCFVNPLTTLGMLETMRLEGHTAVVHTAAASNLGQMLNKLCLADGVGLVNIVRNASQTALLKSIGATYICDSSSANFDAELEAALIATGATLAFDAIGGGHLASRILSAMERAATSSGAAIGRYGSTQHKQVYLYGMLDTTPTVLQRDYGMAWGTGGWLLPNFLERVGPVKAGAMRERVASEITTIFASHYTQEISLHEALQVDIAQRYHRKATGEKFLLNPNKGL